MRLPAKAVTDSELISASDSDVLPVSKGAKRQWRSHRARIDRGQSTGISFRVHAFHRSLLGDLRSDTNSLTCGRTETRSGHLDSLLLAPRWQPKAKNVGADGNRHKLFAAHHVRHR